MFLWIWEEVQEVLWEGGTVKDSVADFVFFVFLVAMGLTCVAGCGYGIAESTIRQEAVNAGVAEWTVDKEGTKGFKWLSPAIPE